MPFIRLTGKLSAFFRIRAVCGAEFGRAGAKYRGHNTEDKGDNQEFLHVSKIFNFPYETVLF